ncbi:lactonase family protein [Mumia quercus]|uniref:lactonase family protein n=1 Tax=Mumia quercus TaxID=2976125 RepID=UPI0021D2B476|nr:lactonase family protein [Mumia quercus]
MTTQLALLGCYTTDGVPGLQSVRLASDGVVEPLHSLAMESPSCVVWHPTLPVAYATNETLAGGVTAVAVAESGEMRVLGTATTGAAPCHAAVTPDGRWLLTADYVGGTVTLVALASDGRPRATADSLPMQGSGPDADRQDAPHPHMIAAPDASREALMCVDLGTDRITTLTVTGDGRLEAGEAWTLPPGTGPRQALAHPGGDGMLVAGELSATLLHVRLPAGGGDAAPAEVVTEVATTAGHEPTFPAQLVNTPDGSHVLVSNRGPDTLAVFDARTPALDRVAEVPAGAGWPRHFACVDDLDLLLVAGERSGTIASYALGAAGPTGTPTTRMATPAPTWIAVRQVTARQRSGA